MVPLAHHTPRTTPPGATCCVGGVSAGAGGSSFWQWWPHRGLHSELYCGAPHPERFKLMARPALGSRLDVPAVHQVTPVDGNMCVNWCASGRRRCASTVKKHRQQQVRASRGRINVMCVHQVGASTQCVHHVCASCVCINAPGRESCVCINAPFAHQEGASTRRWRIKRVHQEGASTGRIKRVHCVGASCVCVKGAVSLQVVAALPAASACSGMALPASSMKPLHPPNLPSDSWVRAGGCAPFYHALHYHVTAFSMGGFGTPRSAH